MLLFKCPGIYIYIVLISNFTKHRVHWHRESCSIEQIAYSWKKKSKFCVSHQVRHKISSRGCNGEHDLSTLHFGWIALMFALHSRYVFPIDDVKLVDESEKSKLYFTLSGKENQIAETIFSQLLSMHQGELSTQISELHRIGIIRQLNFGMHRKSSIFSIGEIHRTAWDKFFISKTA